MRRSGAFTLIELVAVMLIMGILVALLLSAVLAAREAQRRLLCQTRLAQLGKAVYAYESAHRAFPPDGGPAGRAPHEFLSPYSYFGSLLADLDEGPLATEFGRYLADSGVDYHYPWDGFPRALRVPIAAGVCPADSNQRGLNYRGNSGSTIYPQGYRPVPEPGFGGAFPQFQRLVAADFRDGLSNTSGISEKLTSPVERVTVPVDSAFDPRTDAWLTGYAHLPHSGPVLTDEFLRVCDSAPSEPSSYLTHAGSSWAHGSYFFSLYNHVRTPNPGSCDCDGYGGTAVSPLFGIYSARSYHRGGVNVMQMDSSIRFVANSIDIRTWRALGTRAGSDLANGE